MSATASQGPSSMLSEGPILGSLAAALVPARRARRTARVPAAGSRVTVPSAEGSWRCGGRTQRNVPAIPFAPDGARSTVPT
jgi:hypothetical protein